MAARVPRIPCTADPPRPPNPPPSPLLSPLQVLKDSGSGLGRAVEGEVRRLCEGALAAAREVVALNIHLHEELSEVLAVDEKLEGPRLRVGAHGAEGSRNRGT
jgi:hypothetical protein